MNVFLKELSEEYKDDLLVLVCDGAAWHKSNALQIPSNVTITYIPPYTPEMNPIEQIWRELRTQGFCNEVFQTLDAVIDRLCATIQKLTRNTVWSITSREWMCNIFN